MAGIAALSGVRVLDATGSVAGQYCGRLLADFGAEVFLAEPEGGTPTRFRPPFARKRKAPENSYLFENLNTGKSSVILNLSEGRARDIAKTMDVILVDAKDRAALGNREAIGDPIVCAISDFGTSGPYAGWQGGEMIQQALSGVMLVTGSGDREPLYGVGQRASYACGTTAYITVLAALWNRHITGKGQDVETNVAEAAAAMAQNLVGQYGYSQTYPSRVRYGGALAEIECKDGWLVVFALRHFRHLAQTFGLDNADTDPRYESMGDVRPYWEETLAALTEKGASRPVDEIIEKLQEKKISSSRMSTVQDLLDSKHFKARGFWREIGEGPDKHMTLGPVFRLQSPSRTDKPAPKLGAHDPARLTLAQEKPKPKSPVSRTALPLQGVRVLDFTQAWAGPFASRALAFLGAEVIRIENADKLDSWRGPADGRFDPNVYFRKDNKSEPYNKHCWFNTQNHDKKTISLDLKNPKGKALALKLAAQSDVVLANFAPGSMNRMGLGYEELRKMNPEVILVEMPAYGNTGPMSAHAGMGKTMEASAGMASLIGYGDGRPVLTGPAHLDPIGGLHGASAVLTALNEKARTGKGQYVEVAQVDAAMHWIGEYILQTAVDGVTFKPDGNTIDEAVPHDAFACAGNDEWVAIACFNDAQWDALKKATGIKAFDDPAYASPAGRLAARSAINEALTAWTKIRNKHDCANMLQAAGVPAAPVNNGGDVFRDPHLRSRGFIYEIDHPVVGRSEYTSLAYRLHGTPGSIRKPAPPFGADNDEVLGNLGLSKEDIAALVEECIVYRAPIFARKKA